MTLRPLSNSILFEFLDRTGGAAGAFSERTRSGLIIPKTQSTQRKERWGRVLYLGPDVEGVQIGEFILIEPLMWTTHETFEGQKIWKTNSEKVLMVTGDESLTVSY